MVAKPASVRATTERVAKQTAIARAAQGSTSTARAGRSSSGTLPTRNEFGLNHEPLRKMGPTP